MPANSDSAWSKLRVHDPDDDDNYVDVPIWIRLAMRAPQERGQDYVYRFKNDRSRKYTVQTIIGTQSTTDHKMKVEVCRIQRWDAAAPAEQNQAWAYKMNRGGDEPPVHEGDHFDIKIENPDNDQNWVIVRQWNRFNFITPQEQGQEYRWRMTSAPGDNDSEDLGDTIETGPPYMLDPTQDIIDVHWGQKFPTEHAYFLYTPIIAFDDWSSAFVGSFATDADAIAAADTAAGAGTGGRPPTMNRGVFDRPPGNPPGATEALHEAMLQEEIGGGFSGLYILVYG